MSRGTCSSRSGRICATSCTYSGSSTGSCSYCSTAIHSSSIRRTSCASFAAVVARDSMTVGVCMCNRYCNCMSVCTCSMSRTPHAWSSESGHESPSQSAEENTSDETQSDAGGESSDGAESDCTGLRPVPCPVPAPTPDKKHVAGACTPGKPPGSSVKVKHARQLERERKRRARLARKTLSDHKFYVSPSQRRADLDGACCPKGC